MNKYHVTYYYLATGMEGHAEREDYGIVYAKSAQEAINIVGHVYSNSDKEWERNWGLSAELVS